MSSKPPADKDSKALLGDLQRIRSLLEKEDASAPPPEDDVPLLDDALADETPTTPLANDVFDRLLGDDWKADADEVLREARHSIDAGATAWTPEDTDALNDALRIRIDQTIQQWLEDLLSERIGELRARVLAAMTDEIELRVKEPLAQIEPTDLLAAIRRGELKDQDGS